MDQGNKYLVPISIVVAGALVAGAVFMSRGGSKGQAGGTQNDPSAQTAKIALAPVSASEHLLGNPDAPLVLVEYSDTDCPFCQRFHVTMQQVMDTYGKEGKVAWAYRHFPIPQLHPDAPAEAVALECAAELGGNVKFWEFADILYARQRTEADPGHPALGEVAKGIGLDQAAFEACAKDQDGSKMERINTQVSDAGKAGGQGTPHNVIVLKKKLSDKTVNELMAATSQYAGILVVSEDKKLVALKGALPFPMLMTIIDTLLASQA